MSINNAPARFEGPHSQLGALIQAEAQHHLDIALALARDDPELATEPPRDPDRRRSDIANGLWQMVTTGWCRPLADWSGMVFFNPTARNPETGECDVFEPWSAELNTIFIHLLHEVRPIVKLQSQAVINQGIVDELGDAILADETTNYGKHVH